MADKIRKILDLYKEELFERVLPFWQKHSLDKEYGGYFNCLDEDGSVYDTKKYMWLQGRQAWMFAKLYNTVEKRSEWLEAARLGIDFIREHGFSPGGRVYFCLTREGKPYFIQRKIFSECFTIMALAEYARATEDASCQREAENLFRKILPWAKDLSLLGRPALEGMPPTSSLAIPMILLNLIDELGPGQYDDIAKECLQEIRLHVHEEKKAVLENVGTDGSLIDSHEGRLLNPGHAIESAWFLLRYLEKHPDEEMKSLSLKIITWSMERGWDKDHGGIYYFLDLEDKPLTQLEWSMKLWWPHTEALYALLLAHTTTKDKRYLDNFFEVHDWTFSHFPDKKHGGWYGYLDRQGNRTHTLKGGPYKGCFHVPRFLLYSIQLLDKS